LSDPIPFVDLQAQRRVLGAALDGAIARVLERGDFIQGAAVGEFEAALAEYTGASHVVSCANGTDALTLVGMAEELGEGDAVFLPAFTFAATAEAFMVLGATPCLVDVRPDTFNMNPERLAAAVSDAKAAGLSPRMVVAVDLFGQPADYDDLAGVAREHDMVLVADAAQSIGGMMDGRMVGTLADYTTTSFFPAKPLGCYGDGGAVMIEDAGRAELVRSLALHGRGKDKYDNVRVGLNSRLDTLQAAVLIEKLKIFENEVVARNAVANRYTDALGDVVHVPVVGNDKRSCWAQYTIKVDNRHRVRQTMADAGIPTQIYYPKPLHHLAGYKDCRVPSAGLAVSETLSGTVLSLPMHAYLEPRVQDRIVSSTRQSAGNDSRI